MRWFLLPPVTELDRKLKPQHFLLDDRTQPLADL